MPNKGHGKRDFWYPASRIHKDFNSSIAMDPSMENFGLQWGHGGMCEFPTSEDMLTLTTGRIPHEGDLPYDAKGVPTESNGFVQLTNIAHAGQEVDVRFPIRFTWESKKVFANYLDLKSRVNVEYQSERDQIASGNRSDIDPFVFDLHRSIHLIEQFGEKLEQIAYLRATNKSSSLPIGIAVGQGLNTSKMFSFPRRLDWCECQNLLKCHNGTATAGEGATDISDCFSTKSEVLHRISLLPSSSVNGSTRSMSTQEGSIDDTILPLELNPFETAILTIELSMLPNNFTYGEHYRISIYDNCKPCPLRYHCERAISGARKPQTCAAPTMERQTDHLNGCLKENRKMVCLRQDGSHEDIQKCLSRQNEDGSSSSGDLLLFSEPDIEKCLSRPYFCSDAKWNYRTFRRLCQDKTETGHGEVYDCSLVHRWEVYSQWRDKVCCSEVPELRGIDSCRDNVCVDDPLIEDIIRGKMINVFELENGYVPPTEKPLGQLLMNMTLQEARDHDSPFHLFHEWQDSFTQTSHNDQKVKLHNANEPELSRSYKTTKGCCDCTRHSMPYFFEKNIPPFSGFPDNKHDSIQLTISAVARVKLTIAVELVHGAFYSEFARYFGARDKSALRVHVPSRFTENAKYATWLTMLEKSVFDNLNLDLPLNLPTSVHNDGGNKLEIRFIVDRPSNISIGDHHFIKHNRGNIDEDASKYYDDGKALEASYSVKDPIETIREEDNWWKSQPDFLALPYIPFFSNCDGYDSHIGWGRLLEEHPDCLAVPSNHTEATKEYSFQSNAPISDKCIDVKLQCTYEEEITDARENLRWFETPSKSTLFYIVSHIVS